MVETEKAEWEILDNHNIKKTSSSCLLKCAVKTIAKMVAGSIMLYTASIPELYNIVKNLTIELSSSSYKNDETIESIRCFSINNKNTYVFLELSKHEEIIETKCLCSCNKVKLNVNLDVKILKPKNNIADIKCRELCNAHADELLLIIKSKHIFNKKQVQSITDNDNDNDNDNDSGDRDGKSIKGIKNKITKVTKVRLSNNRWGSKKYLDRHINHLDIIGWSSDNKNGQIWNIEYFGPHKVRLWNDRWGEKLYLDRHTNSLDIIVWEYDDKGGQIWNIEELDNNVHLWNDRWGEKLYLDRHVNRQDIIACDFDDKGGQIWKIETIH
jgi:hypothetical protein